MAVVVETDTGRVCLMTWTIVGMACLLEMRLS